MGSGNFPWGFNGNNFPHITGARISCPNKSPKQPGAPFFDWFFLLQIQLQTIRMQRIHIVFSLLISIHQSAAPAFGRNPRQEKKSLLVQVSPKCVPSRCVESTEERKEQRNIFSKSNFCGKLVVWDSNWVLYPLRITIQIHFRGSHEYKSKSAGPRNQQPKNLC